MTVAVGAQPNYNENKGIALNRIMFHNYSNLRPFQMDSYKWEPGPSSVSLQGGDGKGMVTVLTKGEL